MDAGRGKAEETLRVVDAGIAGRLNPDSPAGGAPNPEGPMESEARRLLGAANVLGGLWTATAGKSRQRGVGLIAWGMQTLSSVSNGAGSDRGVFGGCPIGTTRQPGPLAHLATIRPSIRDGAIEAAAGIRGGGAAGAIAAVDSLRDEVPDPNLQEVALIDTLVALGHLAEFDAELAQDALDGGVQMACSTICSSCSPLAEYSVDVPRQNDGPHKIQARVYEVMLAARSQIEMNRTDRVVHAVEKMLEQGRVTSATFKDLRPAGGLKQSRRFGTTRLEAPDRVALWLLLARTHARADDLDAAIAAYEEVLELEGGGWQLDMTRERLANLHYQRGDYANSLEYQRRWLKGSDWVEQACSEVCGSRAAWAEPALPSDSAG